MANHNPDSVSYREGLDESPFAHGDPEVDQRVAAAFSGGPLAETAERDEITEHSCVDSRWSDAPSIPTRIPEDIETRANNVPTRDECQAEHNAWIENSAQKLANRIWDEAAQEIADARLRARVLEAEPQTSFTLSFTEVPHDLEDLTTENLTSRFDSIGWTVQYMYDTSRETLTVELY